MWAAQYYHFSEPGRFISSGGLGTTGSGLPAAVGAQVAAPDKLVVDIAGDGSISDEQFRKWPPQCNTTCRSKSSS
ncbi:MAG: thiamine pyrophosphate-dependent enzyme [Desulfobacterales bacterium]